MPAEYTNSTRFTWQLMDLLCNCTRRGLSLEDARRQAPRQTVRDRPDTSNGHFNLDVYWLLGMFAIAMFFASFLLGKNEPKQAVAHLCTSWQFGSCQRERLPTECFIEIGGGGAETRRFLHIVLKTQELYRTVEAAGVELFRLLILCKLLKRQKATSAKNATLPDRRYKNGTKPAECPKP